MARFPRAEFGKKTTTRGIFSACLTNPGRTCGVSMDKPLSRRIGAAVCSVATSSVFSKSQPSLTYELAIASRFRSRPGRVTDARSVANLRGDLVVYEFFRDHARESPRSYD